MPGKANLNILSYKFDYKIAAHFLSEYMLNEDNNVQVEYIIEGKSCKIIFLKTSAELFSKIKNTPLLISMMQSACETHQKIINAPNHDRETLEMLSKNHHLRIIPAEDWWSAENEFVK